MNYDAIIFDLDGTLWDATETSTIGWNNGLESLGIDRRIIVSDIQSVTGKPTEECIKILLPDEYNKYNSELLKTLDIYEKEAIIKFGGKIYDHCFETIKLLHNGYKLFIVSNCQDWYLDAFLKHSDTKKYFSDCNCHGLSNSSKTVMLQNFKKQYNLHKPVYIGDTIADKIAAEEAGYDFIYAIYGFGNITYPVKQINSLSELI